MDEELKNQKFKMSILFITCSDAFDITTKYFSRTLSDFVLKYIGLKGKNELRY